MIIINDLVTPLNKNHNIDIVTFNKLIDISLKNENDMILLFSPFGDGHLLSMQEKIALINSIKLENIRKIIFYFQLQFLQEDELTISFLQDSSIEYVLLCPPIGYQYHQNGLFIYISNIINKLKNKKIILYNNPTLHSVCFHSQTINKLLLIHKNIFALYENSKDISLINLLKKNNPSLNIFTNEKYIENALKHQLNGIVSQCSLMHGKEYKEIIDDYENNYLNKNLIDYLLFVTDILSFSNNSTLFKAYLKKLGFPSMEVRLPLIIDKNDIENLDFLLS